MEACRKCGEWSFKNFNLVIDGPIHLLYVILPKFSNDSLKYFLHYASKYSMNNVSDYFLNLSFNDVNDVRDGPTSTSDPLSNMGIQFQTKEATMEYAQKNGHEIKVTESKEGKNTFRLIGTFKRSMCSDTRFRG